MRLKWLLPVLLSAATVSAEVSVRNGKFYLNGQRIEHLLGRSSFKLSNIVTYHYTGQGGGEWSLGAAQRWIDHNKELFGSTPFVLRVFLETAGWSECENCMFGSEPRDQGFWQRERLRDGNREREVHPVGKRVLRWFFETSQREVDRGFNVAFELVIDATLKHDDIPKGEIDHVIRQVGLEMGRLAEEFPRALIIPNARNEWNAHNESGHSLAEVNMWAVRWDRDGYWPGAPLIVDGGGGNTFDYDVGPEAGKFRAGLVHPDRGSGWEFFPTSEQLARLRRDARGMPVGANESMYYVEPEDRPRAENWYRPGGWTSDWPRVRSFYEHAASTLDYLVFHDEKGAQSDPEWPRGMTRLEAWILKTYGSNSSPPPDPDPEPPPSETYTYISPPDENGVRYIHIEFEGWPKVVPGISSDDAVLESHLVDLGQTFTFYAAGSFIGTDRGDVGEYDARMRCEGGPHFYERSEHIPTPAPYDAEDWKYANNVTCRYVRVYLGARTTGPNNLLRPGQPWSSRPHITVHLWTLPTTWPPQ